jgi:hypothetical protein
MANTFENKAFSDLISRIQIDMREVQRIGAFSIPPDIDLSRVVSRFVHWLLIDPEGVRQYATSDVLKAMDAIAALYARRLSGEKVLAEEWNAVSQQAGSAMKGVPEGMAAACEAGIAAEAAAEPEGIQAWLVAFSAAEVHACAVDDGQEETQIAVGETFQSARSRIAVKLLELVKAEADTAD